jgi:Holliday junction resolvasome RuvABC endonuclease subunit
MNGHFSLEGHHSLLVNKRISIMAIEDQNQQRQIQTALVLANASTLVSNVVQQIAGNDISTSINGSKATSSLIETLANQRIVKRLTAGTR